RVFIPPDKRVRIQQHRHILPSRKSSDRGSSKSDATSQAPGCNGATRSLADGWFSIGSIRTSMPEGQCTSEGSTIVPFSTFAVTLIQKYSLTYASKAR